MLRPPGGPPHVIELLRLQTPPPASIALPRDGVARERQVLFERLVDDHYRAVYAFAYRMVRSEQDAADVTQDVFVRAWRALPKLRADAALWSWLRRITVNVCLDHIRRQRTAPPSQSLDHPVSMGDDAHDQLEVPDTTTDPAVLLAEDERRHMLEGAILGLGEPYRTAVLLHHVAEMSVEEIAALARVPEGTIKSRLCRARRMLRRRLAPYLDQPAG